MTYPTKKLEELEDYGIIELGRGQVISKIAIANNPGDYPIYSAAQLNNGEFGRWGTYNFDEELITWSVDGGGQFFYRPKHKFSVTNVCGWLRILKPEVLDYKYLFWVLRKQHDELTFDYVNKAHPSVIRPLYSIPVPPIAEQKKIVEKIERQFAKIDEVARLRATAQALTEEVLPAALHEIFSSAEAKGWEEKELGKIAKFIDYRGKTPLKTASGMRLITAKNVKLGYLSKTPEEFVDPTIYDSWMTRGIPKVGDVLFTTEAPLANVAQLDIEDRVVFAQRIIILQPDKSLDSAFLKYSLMGGPVRETILSQATGVTAQGIKASKLKLIKISLPPLAEQKNIVKKLDALSEKARTLCDFQSSQSAALKSLKQSILHEAFSNA